MGRKISFINSMIKRHKTCISPFAVLNSVVCEDNVGIKAFAKLERVEIGKCTYVGSMAAAYDCKIGRFCSIARDVYIGGGTHPTQWVSTSPCFHIKDNAVSKYYGNKSFQWSKETIIGNDVWIGVRAIILPGVIVGDGAVIGAGSVVTKNVGSYEIWAGNPARLIRKRFDDDIIANLVEMKWWDWDDNKLEECSEMIDKPELFAKSI